MHLTIWLDREKGGGWMAGVPELPGVFAYGASQQDVLRRAVALGLRVIADRLESGEGPALSGILNISFAVTS